MRYKSQEEAQQDHIQRYRSDGVSKGKGTRLSSDFYRVQWILSKVTEGSSVLDVGCNGGTIAIPLMQELKCYVKGIDIVEELVEKAKKRGVYAQQGTAEKLDFKDAEFDHVICAEVLEHLYNPIPAIEEAYRVLKKGGTYIVTVPHPDNPLMAGDNLGDYHQQNFSTEILDTMFHMVFDRGDAFVYPIPYVEEFCRANMLKQGTIGWFGIEAKK